MSLEKFYIEIKKGKKAGPYAIEDLSNKINADTLIWYQGLDSWKKASEIEPLNLILNNIPPPLPKEKSYFDILLETIIRYRRTILISVSMCMFSFALIFSILGGFIIDDYEKTYFLNEEKINELHRSKKYTDEYTLKLHFELQNETRDVAKLTFLEYILNIGESSWSSSYYREDFKRSKLLILLFSIIFSLLSSSIVVFRKKISTEIKSKL
jgi:hypothetical protein